MTYLYLCYKYITSLKIIKGDGSFEISIVIPLHNLLASYVENALFSDERVSKKWTRAYPNWDLVISQLKILFAEVLNKGA